MDTLDLLHGDKEVAYGTRHVADDEELSNELRPLQDLGLEYGFNADFDSVAELKPDERRGSTPVYAVQFAASREADLIDRFFYHLDQGNEREAGQALGYPACCAETFHRHFKDEDRSIGEHVLTKTQEFDVYPFHTNRFLRWEQPKSFLYHFPCRYGCEKSVEIAKRRQQLLQEFDAERAAYMQSELRSLIIYRVNRECSSGDVRDETDVVYASDYTYDADDQTVRVIGEFQKGRPRTDEAFFERFQDGSPIEIVDVDNFIVDEENVVSGDNIRIVPFR